MRVAAAHTHTLYLHCKKAGMHEYYMSRCPRNRISFDLTWKTIDTKETFCQRVSRYTRSKHDLYVECAYLYHLLIDTQASGTSYNRFPWRVRGFSKYSENQFFKRERAREQDTLRLSIYNTAKAKIRLQRRIHSANICGNLHASGVSSLLRAFAFQWAEILCGFREMSVLKALACASSDILH